MKNSSVIFFTDSKEKHSRLIDMLDLNSNLSLCTYSSDSWTDIDFYSNKNVAFVMDEMPHTKESSWILSKLSEAGLFAEIPILFTSYDAMYEFERSGFASFAYDVFPEPFDYELAYRRFQNICEIRQLKFQIYNLSQIHTKRILNQANKLKEQNARMQTINYDLVELLVAAIESRDLESGQHIKRIRFFTKALVDAVMASCPEYNITKEQAEYIYYASSVHDIGKIAIPDAIMLKPGRLTQDEFEIMKTHTTRGYALLNMLDGIDAENQYFKYCQEICHYHHERWDGRGYPDGLVGDETPISAQIVAICDCYDALTSHRPYKSAMTHDEAVDLITAGGCGEFSPKLLKCFEAVLPEFAKIESEFKSDIAKIPENAFASAKLNEVRKAEASNQFTDCEESVLAGHDIIFEANVKKGYFNIVRGEWTWLFPYVPKNFTEAISQCLRICHPADAARFATKVNIEAFSELCKAGKRKTRVEFRIIKDGEEYLAVGFIIFVADDDNNLVGLNGVFNIYDNDEMLTDIKRGFGVTDSLTGLPLQKQFEVDVNSYLKDNIQSKNLLIHIDIDNMSTCNNLFGYEYGNVLIKEFASKLRGVSTKDKIVGKAASDKFYLFVKNVTNQAEVAVFIENLHNLLKKPYKTATESGVFTASMGIARYPNDGKDFKSLSIASEYAAKTAKMNGDSSYAFFNPTMQNLASYSVSDDAFSKDKTKEDYEPKFVPVVDAKTGELVCYDYIPYYSFNATGALSTEAFYEINRNDKNAKNLSIVSIKSLLYMLIGLRNTGKKELPPVSIYTMFSKDDLPSLLQELKTFISENDCSGIKLTLLLPQNILDEINVSRLKNLSKYIHKLGFELGLYLLGARYIHNYCHIYDLFDRYVVKSEYITHAVCSNGNIKYCADTLAILKKFVKDLTVPSEVSAYEKELMFKGGFSDFSHAETAVDGLNELMADYAKRQRKIPAVTEGKTKVINELDPSVAFYGILNSGIIWIIYDIQRQRLSITPNATEIFGFDIFNVYYGDGISSVLEYVHPDDMPKVHEMVSQVKMSLDIVFFDIRIKSGYDNNSYKNYSVALVCSVDESGSPARFQITLSSKSE